MSLLVPTRRGLLQGLGLVLAAPAIVRVASIMPVRGFGVEGLHRNGILTMNEITREAIKLWNNSNTFLQAREDWVLLSETSCRIRLPNNWTANHV